MDQIKKEPEPVPEAVKTEEKETVKNVQSAGAKGPPEKRMRLQWREKLLHIWISLNLENRGFLLSILYI